MGTNVKELLFDNVRGRVREMIWNEVKKDLDKYEAEKNPDDKQKIAFLYKRCKQWYAEYQSLLEDMEKDETAKNPTGHSTGDAPKRSRGRPHSRPEDSQGQE